MKSTQQLQEQVFSTYESWDTFLKLRAESEDLKTAWSKEFQVKLKEEFKKKYPKWQVHNKGGIDFFINLKDAGSDRKSLEIWFEYDMELNLFDSSKDKAQIRTAYEKLSPLIELFCQKLKYNHLVLQNEQYLIKHSLKNVLSIDNKRITQKEQLYFFAADGRLVEYFDSLLGPLLGHTDIEQLFEQLLYR